MKRYEAADCCTLNCTVTSELGFRCEVIQREFSFSVIILWCSKGSFTINVRRTFRFLRFFFTPTHSRTKMSAQKRYQNGNVRPFFGNLKTPPLEKMSGRTSIVNDPYTSSSCSSHHVQTSTSHCTLATSQKLQRSHPTIWERGI